jgi:hypothetical protein
MTQAERDMKTVPAAVGVRAFSRPVPDQELVEERERGPRSAPPTVPLRAGLELEDDELATAEKEEVGLRFLEVVFGDLAHLAARPKGKLHALHARGRPVFVEPTVDVQCRNAPPGRAFPSRRHLHLAMANVDPDGLTAKKRRDGTQKVANAMFRQRLRVGMEEAIDLLGEGKVTCPTLTEVNDGIRPLGLPP